MAQRRPRTFADAERQRQERAAKDAAIRAEELKAIEAATYREAEDAEQPRLNFGGRHSRQAGWKGPNR
jgi:hypothetical protein